MQLERAIKTRKSVKRFSSKKPDWRKIIRAIDAGRYAPMAGNLFSLKFILVKDSEKMRKLAEASQQDFVSQAFYAVVVVSDDKRVEQSYGERGEKYARQQAGAAIENLLLALNSLGLATCWVGAFVDEQVKETLSIPDNFTVEAILPIGFETKVKTSGKLKTELENVLFFDKFGNKYFELKKVATLDAI